jgi:hypothetical protein
LKIFFNSGTSLSLKKHCWESAGNFQFDLPSCFCAEQIVWRNANLTGINDLAKKDSLRGEIQVVSIVDPARILSSELENTGL